MVKSQIELFSSEIIAPNWDDASRQLDECIAKIDNDISRLMKEIRHLSQRKRELLGLRCDFNRGLSETHRKTYLARRREANESISKKEIRLSVFIRDGFKCKECHSTKRLSIDHIIPVACGGSDEISNLQTLCFRCNCKKGAGKFPKVSFAKQANLNIKTSQSDLLCIANTALKEARLYMNNELKINSPKRDSRMTKSFANWFLTNKDATKEQIYEKAVYFCKKEFEK